MGAETIITILAPYVVPAVITLIGSLVGAFVGWLRRGKKEGEREDTLSSKLADGIENIKNSMSDTDVQKLNQVVSDAVAKGGIKIAQKLQTTLYYKGYSNTPLVTDTKEWDGKSV